MLSAKPRKLIFLFGLAGKIWFAYLSHMKRTLKIAILGLLLAGLCAFSTQAQSRYATVDLQKLFQNFYKTKQALASLKDRAGELDKTRKDMITNYQSAQEEYKKLLTAANDQAVTADERDKRKTAAQNKLKDLNDLETNIKSFDAQAQSALDEQKKRLTDGILNQIKTAVSDRARKDGYTLVLDTTTPIVVYYSGDSDLTDSVLKALNETAPIELQTPADRRANTNAPAKK